MKIGDQPAFPRPGWGFVYADGSVESEGSEEGITYRQWLVGQAPPCPAWFDPDGFQIDIEPPPKAEGLVGLDERKVLDDVLRNKVHVQNVAPAELCKKIEAHLRDRAKWKADQEAKRMEARTRRAARWAVYWAGMVLEEME